MSEQRYFDIAQPVDAKNELTGQPLKTADPDFTGNPKVPANQQVVPLVVDRPWTMRRWFAAFVATREEWMKGVANQLLAHKVLNALDVGEEWGMRVGVPLEAHRKLRKTFEDEDFEVPFPIGPQTAHFAAVFIDATDKAVIETPEAEDPAEESAAE